MAEIRERETMNETLSKYIAVFDYFDITLLAWSSISGGVSIVPVSISWCTSWNNGRQSYFSKKYKKICKYLNYVEHLLILVSTVIGCVSISEILISKALP